MAFKCATEQLFIAVENESVNKQLIDDVRRELDLLGRIQLDGESAKQAGATLQDLNKLLQNVSDGQLQSAKAKCNRMRACFRSYLKRNLKDYMQTSAANGEDNKYPREPPVDYDQPPDNRVDNYQKQAGIYPHNSNIRDSHAGHRDLGSSDMALSNVHLTYPDQKKSVAAVDDETEEKRKRGQRASQAMRHNNPDIADLSDTNRPTKIAERFSELYDNEWTEAFDILSNKKKTEEKKITQLLLQIVQEAYAFCKQEAEQEITAMHSAIINILEFGEIKGNSKKEKPLDASLLVQYRKENASIAIKRLQKEFFETKLKTICTSNLGGMPPIGDGPTAKYGRKAVELTWWMCVQDPPVHMVSTKDEFNPDFYRAYTKSGTRLDFFVWPALRLHETGGILTKGVVQYE